VRARDLNLPRSSGTTRTSLSAAPALARISPAGPATKLWPQNQCLCPPAFHAPRGWGRRRSTHWRSHGRAGSFPKPNVAARRIASFQPVPADGSGTEEDFGALQRSQSSGFGIPLVPTDEHADLRVTGLPGAKAKVTGGEIELLAVQRVVRDVHLAVEARSEPSASMTAAVLW